MTLFAQQKARRKFFFKALIIFIRNFILFLCSFTKLYPRNTCFYMFLIAHLSEARVEKKSDELEAAFFQQRRAAEEANPALGVLVPNRTAGDYSGINVHGRPLL